MENKTRGIVIRSIKYGESSAICNIYTEQYGLLGFHVPSVYTNKGKVKISFLQSLNTLELSLNYNKNRNLQRIRDIQCLSYIELKTVQQQAFYHVVCELLQQTVRENEIHSGFFDYLYHEVIPGINTEIQFWQIPFVMLNVLHHYGCAPNCSNYSEDACLDLQNGVFLDSLLPLMHIADKQSSGLIYHILNKGIHDLPKDTLLRQNLINDLIKYYQWHVNEKFDLKSREILQMIHR